MKMRTFDLAVYEYEEFIKEAQDYVLKEVTHDGQGVFFFSMLECISKEAFLDWIKLGLVVVFVIDGKAKRKIPFEKRHCTVEYFDAAFIVY